jgi:hypothetical protein
MASRLVVGKPDRHELHSEIHGILLAVTAQAASTAQIRDAVAAFVASPKSADDSHLDALRDIRDTLALKTNIAENGSAQRQKLWQEQVEGIQGILKGQQGQLEATKKLDDRLFEFVNSTKRIMRAMEGGVGGDDDTLIEAARDIRMRAADKGIELTLEECIKRAREQANFR